MNYPFVCPDCGHEKNVSMPINEYVSTGHHCPICHAEMVREVKSLVCGLSIDKTSTFYRKCN